MLAQSGAVSYLVGLVYHPLTRMPALRSRGALSPELGGEDYWAAVDAVAEATSVVSPVL